MNFLNLPGRTLGNLGKVAKVGAVLLSCGFHPLLSSGVAQEKAQFAVVDYGSLFKDYYKAADSKQKLEKKQEEFKKDMEERMNAANQILKDAKKLQEDLQSPVLSEARKKEISGQLREKQIEFEGRQKMAVDFRDQTLGLLQKSQINENEAVTTEINKAVAIVAKNKYTIVFAKSQGSPVPGGVTFCEGIDDITQQVLAILNKDAPKGPKKDETK